MAVKSPEDLFITTLSHLHSAETRTKAICDELAQMAQEPDVKKWFELTSYLEGQHLASVEQCFKMLSKQPEKTEGRWVDAFAENFRNVSYEIQSPEMKALYLLATIRKIQNFHIAEYGTLAVMAGFAGYDGVALLLERNREDKISYIERANEMLASRVRQELGGRVRQELGERMLKRVA
jgi:ferritin-like metal-binding protein YciE